MKRNGMEEQYVIDDFTSKDTWRIFRIIAEFVEGFEMLARIPPAVAIFGSARTQPGTVAYEKAQAIASIRARRMSTTRCVTNSGLRGSAIKPPADRRSQYVARQRPKSIRPPSEVRRPPSKAAVTFLRPTAGKHNGGNVSSVMAGVAREIWWKGWPKQPNPTPNQPLKLHPPASPTNCQA